MATLIPHILPIPDNMNNFIRIPNSNRTSTIIILIFPLIFFQFLIYKLLLHHSSNLHEDITNWLPTFGATFEVGDLVLVCELLCLLFGDLSLLYEVVLGANKDNLCVLLDCLREFVDPVAWVKWRKYAQIRRSL